MNEPKYDPATAAQLATIAAQATATKAQETADKNAKDIKELEKTILQASTAYWQTSTIHEDLINRLQERTATMEKELTKLRDDHNELAVEVRGLGKQDAEKPKEVNLLEVIRNLFKRK